MKGIILAGGTGSRLYPLTKITNKHLLPIYNKPMIYYPLYTLKEAGITEVMIVSGRGHVGSFLELLGSGSQFGMKLTYEIQEEAGGIAQALSLTEDFVNGDSALVLLGDNIIEDNISEAVNNFKKNETGAKIFLKEVHNPESYGVAEVDGNKIKSIIEKPANPKSNLAVIGAYIYDQQVFELIKNLKPSDRGELEITDVNNFYLNKANLQYSSLKGFWGDAGESFDSMVEATDLVQNSLLANIDENLNLLDRSHNSLKSNEKCCNNRVNSI